MNTQHQQTVLISLPVDELQAIITQCVNSCLTIHGLQDKVVSQTTRYLSTKRAAEFLGKTPNALRVMVHKDQIKSIKKGNSLFFLELDLVDYLESGRRQNKTESFLNCEEALVTRKRGN